MMNKRDAEFMFEMIESGAQALYARGYKDALEKKPQADATKIKLSINDKMRIQKIHSDRSK